MVRLDSKQKAESRATDLAVLLANGRGDLLHIDAGELAEFKRWKAACSVSVPISEACTAFVALKKAKSSRHIQSLERDLGLFQTFIGPTQPIGASQPSTSSGFLISRDVGKRRKFNLRVRIVSLFRWARRMSYLPDRHNRSRESRANREGAGTSQRAYPGSNADATRKRAPRISAVALRGSVCRYQVGRDCA